MAEETAENKASRQVGWDLPKWTLCYVQSLIKKSLSISWLLSLWNFQLHIIIRTA